MNTTQSPPTGKKLLDQARDALRAKHYSRRTEGTYVDWARQFILFHNKRHPREMNKTAARGFTCRRW